MIMIPKFRAWIKAEKKMYEVDGINTAYNRVYTRHKIFLLSELILLQSPGLKDKNGKEIFEGDVVVCSTIYNKVNIEHRGTVVFERGAFIVGSKTMTDSYMTFIELDSDWDTEIIGNIHEHSHLLKEADND